MNRQYLFLCVFILVLNVSRFNAFEVKSPHSSFSQRINEFCNSFYQNVASNLEGNFVSSPINAFIPLLTLAYGAAGKTRQELIEILQLPIDEKFTVKYFRKFIKHFSETQDVEFYTANRIFIGDEFEITPYFRRVSQKLMQSKIKNVDSKDTAVCSEKINAWCRRTTDNKITEIANNDELENMQLVIISVASFRGKWKVSFNNGMKNKKYYLTEEDSISLPMMCSSNTEYNYGLTLLGTAIYIELPYKVKNNKKGLSLYIIMPFEHHNMDTIISNVYKINFKNLNSNTQVINFCMPKFQVKSEINVKNASNNMGLDTIFKVNANFSNISPSPTLAISNIIQTTSITVDEESDILTENTVRSGLVRYEMNVDRPFIAAIVSKATDTPLYWARIYDPRE